MAGPYRSFFAWEVIDGVQKNVIMSQYQVHCCALSPPERRERQIYIRAQRRIVLGAG